MVTVTDRQGLGYVGGFKTFAATNEPLYNDRELDAFIHETLYKKPITKGEHVPFYSSADGMAADLITDAFGKWEISVRGIYIEARYENVTVVADSLAQAVSRAIFVKKVWDKNNQ